MTVLAEFLGAGAVAAALPVPSRKALFQHFGQVAARVYALDGAMVAERLTERERLGSTGFGQGIAIPHAKIDGLDHVVAIFAQLGHAIDFQAVDGLPVDIAFCLLSPPDSGADHLKALAQISRWLRDPSFVAKLRGAGSADALFAVLDGHEARDAAQRGMTPRLASKLIASALVRSVEIAGGFGMILAKGDAEAGSILIVALEKGQITGLYERQMAADMRYVWTGVGPQALDNKAEIDEFVERRRARDPDLWVIELDIPNAPQFIAEFDSLA